MASLSRNRSGGWRIEVTVNGQRHTICPPGKCEKTAEALHRRVEQLHACTRTGDPLPPALAEWVGSIPEALHAKLAKAGLVNPREQRETYTVAMLVERFERSTKALKASTRAAYKQTIDSLRETFGDSRELESISPSDADEWRDSLTSTYAVATVSKRTQIAKIIFGKGVRWKMLAESPFEGLRPGSQCNPLRSVYVPAETVDRLIDESPDGRWRAVFALTRFAGLRCPSELVALNWADVDWGGGRLTVRSPKTAHHGGDHAVRVVPLAPKVRDILLRLFDDAEPGEDRMLAGLDSATNLRTHALRLMARAGVTPWPRLFQNLRASCETDWADQAPGHVVARWLGHSPTIAAKHYLHLRDEHFDLVTRGSEVVGKLSGQGVGNASERTTAPVCAEDHESTETLENKGDTHNGAQGRNRAQNALMSATGLEPVTSAM
ncbi:MAG: site-specific integrase [Phycisphaeraceae bacterium]|nr:MAG: site-specific integrase [Phycisphaeraceae bacterium]